MRETPAWMMWRPLHGTTDACRMSCRVRPGVGRSRHRENIKIQGISPARFRLVPTKRPAEPRRHAARIAAANTGFDVDRGRADTAIRNSCSGQADADLGPSGGGLSTPPVEAVGCYHLGSGGNEVSGKLLFAARRRIDLGDGPKLGVRSEDEVSRCRRRRSARERPRAPDLAKGAPLRAPHRREQGTGP